MSLGRHPFCTAALPSVHATLGMANVMTCMMETRLSGTTHHVAKKSMMSGRSRSAMATSSSSALSCSTCKCTADVWAHADFHQAALYYA